MNELKYQSANHDYIANEHYKSERWFISISSGKGIVHGFSEYLFGEIKVYNEKR